MRFQGFRYKEYLKNEHGWHLWYAWYPVYVPEEASYVWLEEVERKVVLAATVLSIDVKHKHYRLKSR